METEVEIGRLILTVLGLLISTVFAFYNQRKPEATRAIRRTNGNYNKRSTDEFRLPDGLIFSAKDTEVRLTVLERRLDLIENHYKDQFNMMVERLSKIEDRFEVKMDSVTTIIQKLLLEVNNK